MSTADDAERASDHLRTLAVEHAFLARQFEALSLLAASLAAVEILSNQAIAVALALAAAYVSGSGLLRWRSIDQKRRRSSVSAP